MVSQQNQILEWNCDQILVINNILRAQTIDADDDYNTIDYYVYWIYSLLNYDVMIP